MAKVKVKIPKLGLTIETAKLVAWTVAVGDRVEAGAILGTIEADKASYELEAPAAGSIAELLVGPDDEEEHDIGTVVAVIEV